MSDQIRADPGAVRPKSAENSVYLHLTNIRVPDEPEPPPTFTPIKVFSVTTVDPNQKTSRI